MIVEIPTPEEFFHSALNMLNLAWSIGMEVVHELKESRIEEWDDDGAVTSEYWEAAQPALGNALALVQQAHELALKGRICEVSPFLLLSNDPGEWPKGSRNSDVSFGVFRTVDAFDLIRMHNSVHEKPLSDSFTTLFDEVRRQRNRIIHHGRAGKKLDAVELLLLLLETVNHLFPEKRWFCQRLDYLSTDRLAVAYSSDYVDGTVAFEANVLLNHLNNADLKKYFRFDKKVRRYVCPRCNHEARESGWPTAFAQLRPNTPTSDTVYCFVCDSEAKVERKRCENEECPSNVICIESGHENECLVCSGYWP